MARCRFGKVKRGARKGRCLKRKRRPAKTRRVSRVRTRAYGKTQAMWH